MFKTEKVTETQIGSAFECEHCEKLVGPCTQCGKPMKRGYWIECSGERHNHVRCPVGTEPDVWY